MAVDPTAAMTVAGLMELAARTAPKPKGVDTIVSRILTDTEIQALADRLADSGGNRKIGFLFGMQKILRHAMHVVLPGRKGAWLQESTAVPAALQLC